LTPNVRGLPGRETGGQPPVRFAEEPKNKFKGFAGTTYENSPQFPMTKKEYSN